MTALLSARGLGKEYVLRAETSLLLSLRGRRPRRLWALRDVDLDVGAGEVLAVVGRNGAGKSTLLKLASGVTTPTVGSLRRPARIAPLIEVGAGFHPELSGRENIEVNARLLGMDRATLRRQFDDIVAFAELAHAIDQPVKEYSSGMYMRLGFAVAVHTDPELLVVDEVLAVGDLPFQVRCLERIRKLRDGGVGVLFVSHNLSSVADIADRALFLEKGQAKASGDPRTVIAAYQESLVAADDRYVDDGVRRDDRVVIDVVGGTQARTFSPGDSFELILRLAATQDVPGLLVGFTVRRADGFVVGGWHQPVQASLPGLRAGEATTLALRMNLNVVRGSYLLDVGVASADFSSIYCRVDGLADLTVLGPEVAGVADLAPSVETLDVAAPTLQA